MANRAIDALWFADSIGTIGTAFLTLSMGVGNMDTAGDWYMVLFVANAVIMAVLILISVWEMRHKPTAIVGEQQEDEQ